MSTQPTPLTLTPARVQALVAEIHQVARTARHIDPDTRGHISYAYMCGGLQSILGQLVRELADDAAAELIAEAFAAAYARDDESAE